MGAQAVIGGDGRWWWVALVLGVGCAAPTREVQRPAPVAAPVVAVAAVQRPVAVPVVTEPERVPVLLEAAQGDGLIVSTKDGLSLLDAGLKVVKVLSRERGRHLRIADGQLYYFELKQPRLRALDLETGVTRLVAELPRLRSDCFEGGRPADPIAYVQGAGDLSAAAGVLCLDVVDQPGKAATETINFRVDLKTGAVEQQRVAFFSGAVCGEGQGTTQPRLCTPATGAREASSPSGRWRVSTDMQRGQKGEQSYALVVLSEQGGGSEQALVGRKLRALKPGRDAPVDACMITDKARVQWLAKSDVLLVEGCRDRLSAVLPDGHIELRLVDDFVAVPAAR